MRQYRDGDVHQDEVVRLLRDLPYEDLGYAKVDHHRALRKGFPEVIFGQGKTPEQVAEIVEAVLQQSDVVLVTRATPDAFSAVSRKAQDAAYCETARAIFVNRGDGQQTVPGVLVLCGGTADLPVATEAVLTAELMGCGVETVFDVGVAGIHRLLDQRDALARARVVVAVAGMEGALPSVVGGLVDVPVIAVPTSVGYGASFQGLAALLAMLNGCAPGVGVVNIDNGFGAGYLAAMIVLGSHAKGGDQQ